MSDFETVYKEMKRHGMKLPKEKVMVRVPQAKAVLGSAMTYFLKHEGANMLWLPEYADVADWLTDNRGRGLFLYGNCGRGKSLLCRYVLPAILLKYGQRVVTAFDAQEMNRDIDFVLSKHLISLDDVGTEEQSVKYGERRLAFAEIMDAAEKYNKLVIVSTNLSVDDVKKRYGDRILDRILSTTTRVLFEGGSLRQ